MEMTAYISSTYMDNAQHRYEIMETLGMGATSRVDKARDPLIGRIVAVKTFLQGFGSRDLQQQYTREAQIIGRLSHPNIVALYDVGTDKDGVPYLVMEYVEGKTLEAVLAGGPLPLARLAVWGGDLASALGRAHQAKIIHGDVKPANILVTMEGQVKLGDFGVARFTTQVCGSGSVMGTPAYLSPEQILGNSQDTRSDLFSLGIILYQMACGVKPFDGSSVSAVCAQIISSQPLPPSHHNPALPPAFDSVVMRCLSKDPEARYATAEALASSLYPFARASEAVAAKPASKALTRPSSGSWWSRAIQQKDIWAAAACLFIVLSVMSAVRVYRKHSAAKLATSVAGLSSPDGSAPAVSPADGSSSAWMRLDGVSLIDPLSTRSSPSTMEEVPEPATPAVSSKSLRTRPAPRPRAKAEKTAPAQVLPGASTPAGNDKAAPPADVHAAIPAAHSSLRIEIVSAIANETIAVYAGQELLLSTRLEPEHVGESLHFDCPLSPGSHPLRVALYGADLSLHVQKEGLSQILSDGSNTLDIHINRRPKLLIRKETTLEVSWPNPLSAGVRQASPITLAADISK
jgi:serine/threonine protein kinase